MFEIPLDPTALGVALAVAAGVVIVVLVILKGVVRSEHTRDARRKFAARRGLRIEKENGLEVVLGDVDGRSFSLRQKKVGQNAVQWTAELALLGALPEGLGLAPEKIHAEWLKRAVHGKDLEVGVAKFDDQVIVKADDPASINEYLTAARRKAALELVERDGRLEDRSLVLSNVRVVNNLDALDRMLEDLRRIARVLDVHDGRRPARHRHDAARAPAGS